MKLYIKWSNLTDDQQAQVKAMYQDELKLKAITLNRMRFLINKNGDFVPRKDF
jgi:sulfur carrier protein ThiS